jgi:hypothetical protein
MLLTNKNLRSNNMGYYLNGGRLGAKEKAATLVNVYDAKGIETLPATMADIPADKALVAVLENGPFDAALLVPDQDELDYLIREMPNDPRPYQYLYVPKSEAHALAKYREA